MSSPLKSRFLAAAIHLMLSLAVAAVAAGLVFGIWYPYPYREISGGRHLFLIVMAVDVIMGPLLTLAVFNRSKPVAELRRDLTVIGMLQVAALAYGLWTVSVARPVHLVFEIDRFRVVHAIDIPEEEMDRAPPELRQLPWTGPTLLSVRNFRSQQEGSDATLAAVQGFPLGARPFLWQRYDEAKPQILKVARPLGDLKNRFPDQVGIIDAALRSRPDRGTASESVAYVPMAGRDTFWTVLLDLRTTEVIAFVPIDSF
ncbi:MAG: TfpX/TfpZ family type IV pilin accessory protein [Polaromonas sp.]|uniref:TfpX/TfpZ family type IV pilin accessory protein n=1 Tax=Polaromonas sp. TaxID=1869339 RepID=UPI002723F77C|nr:TfpX/TfpZ family type IV pilin accessory protein [Polaromonas sp.]MDO9112742.1 TfpX/TfpZ family type IV pilin accessory protein [Polaromonas sp.]MDP1885312.1 TfpX/TfpZ family type IV pilin accessory protein [Polaromonas sp.]